MLSPWPRRALGSGLLLLYIVTSYLQPYTMFWAQRLKARATAETYLAQSTCLVPAVRAALEGNHLCSEHELQRSRWPAWHAVFDTLNYMREACSQDKCYIGFIDVTPIAGPLTLTGLASVFGLFLTSLGAMVAMSWARKLAASDLPYAQRGGHGGAAPSGTMPEYAHYYSHAPPPPPAAYAAGGGELRYRGSEREPQPCYMLAPPPSQHASAQYIQYIQPPRPQPAAAAARVLEDADDLYA